MANNIENFHSSQMGVVPFVDTSEGREKTQELMTFATTRQIGVNEAWTFRDAIYNALSKNPTQAVKDLTWGATSSLQAVFAQQQFSEQFRANLVQLIIYHDTLFSAAIAGSECFVGEPIEAEYVRGMTNQLWLFDHRTPITDVNFLVALGFREPMCWRGLYLFPTLWAPEIEYAAARYLKVPLTPAEKLSIAMQPEKPGFSLAYIYTPYDKPNNPILRCTMPGFAGGLMREGMAQIYAAHRFLNQERIVELNKVEPKPRSAKAERQSELKRPDIFKIILRRTKKKEGLETEASTEHKDMDWQFRWCVGGHWRNQYYASEGVHRKIYILPFLKGPEGKPLKENTARRIYEVKR